jgi:hypothetical protein
VLPDIDEVCEEQNCGQINNSKMDSSIQPRSRRGQVPLNTRYAHINDAENLPNKHQDKDCVERIKGTVSRDRSWP